MTNARFEDLERRVKKLKLIKFIKIISFFIIFALISYYALDFKRKNESVQIKPIAVEKKEKTEIENKVKVYSPMVKKVEEIAEPTKKIDKDINAYDTLKLIPHVAFFQKDNPVKETLKKEILKQVRVKKEINKKKTINLQVKEVKSEVALFERFKVANDFESALGLTNFYYDKQRYEKAISWSKKASKIKPKEDKPWIIFAKSKFAQGKSKEATDSLELYLDYFSSEEIERLLNNYRRKK